eukprot:CAMPEP_0170574048 /NCGR_PEP_ID=MMETSP0224-20130122/3090_1 /TAXON_ID=285029 /ORGANISM="Togula jolla, Strain CCCM 725" /LENGTH=577 /DNA_ID=CAMNT_0010896675 /DNA_START=37 /DNA_END=1769 /DNA_ORIENTATION=+
MTMWHQFPQNHLDLGLVGNTGSVADSTTELLGAADLEHGSQNGNSGEMGSGARLFIFILFTQLMQALMSYDGGATQMSTQPLLASGWSSSELGLLGAMDKFGQVATAFVWSHLLMTYKIKLLLAVGLFAKATSCLGFGLLRSKPMMLGAKLGMGVSEALIGVWATVWVQSNSPPDSQARWLGFASISAGFGNGIGSAVAGLCSEDYGYAFAFICQAVVLFILWGIMLFTPARLFDFQSYSSPSNYGDYTHVLEQHYEDHRLASNHSFDSTMSMSKMPSLQRSMSLGTSSLLLQQEAAKRISVSEAAKRTSVMGVTIPEEVQLSFRDSLMSVLRSPLWLWTALGISFSCYITSSVAYLWQNTVESVWFFSDSAATYSFLLTTGLGGFFGVVIGPKVYDEYLQGFSTPAGRYLCLMWCSYTCLATAVLGTGSALLLVDIATHAFSDEEPTRSQTDAGLIMAAFLGGVFLVFALVNTMQGTLYGINTDSVTEETKTAAAGLTVSMQNIIGYAFGPLLPDLIADFAGRAFEAARSNEAEFVLHRAQFSIGMASALLAVWPLFLAARGAARAAGLAVPRDGI